MVRPHDLVVSLRDIDHDDIYYVGQKAAHFGGMHDASFSVPPGFAVTSAAYFKFVNSNNLVEKIRHLIGAINFDREDSIAQVATHIKNLITTSKIPDDLVEEIIKHYMELGGAGVTIHASVVSGDHEHSTLTSYRGPREIDGEAVLFDTLRHLWASLFSPALLIHRQKKNIDHLKTGVTAVINKKIRGDISGKIYTVDHKVRDKTKVVIEEDKGHAHVVDRKSKLVSRRHAEDVPMVFVRDGQHAMPGLSEAEVHALVDLGKRIEEHYYVPQQIEWVKEGDRFYIVGVSPLTYA